MCVAAHPQRGRIDNRIITATVDRLDLSELHDCDAIIARGYSARRLKAQGRGVPVIDIAISGYDVIRSIQECQRRFQTRRIGFVGFYNAFNGIEQFSGMFGCDIRVYIPECAAEIRHALELAKQDGCDVIVGGYSVQQDAGLLGLPAILLRTGRETYAQSLEEAIRTVTLVQQERIRTETYKIITESVKDGLLYVDASGIIRLDNPAACLMRDAPLKDVPLETAFPCMKDSFSQAMRDCAEIQGEVRKVRGVSITFDCTPVAVNGIAAGVVISFQNVDKVQQLEGHIRKKLSNKGLTAKHHLSDIVHCSRLIDETIEDACRYAAASSNILIAGETDGQGTVRAGHPQRQPAPQRAVRGHQLRGPARKPARKRAVRLRGGRVHGDDAGRQDGAFRTGPQRDAVPRRNIRNPAEHAEQAPARAPKSTRSGASATTG